MYATWFGAGRANEQEESPRPPKLTTKFPKSPWVASGCYSRFFGARIGEKEREVEKDRAKDTFATLTPTNIYTCLYFSTCPQSLHYHNSPPSTHLSPRKFSPHYLSLFPPPQTQTPILANTLISSLEYVLSTRNSGCFQIEYVSHVMCTAYAVIQSNPYSLHWIPYTLTQGRNRALGKTHLQMSLIWSNAELLPLSLL